MADTSAQFRPGGEDESRSAYKTLFIFTFMMIILPVTSYFVCKSMILEGIFLMSPRKSYLYAAGTAVVVVHVIVAGFIYVAWNEGTRTVPSVKQD